jgi:hypothetical protein
MAGSSPVDDAVAGRAQDGEVREGGNPRLYGERHEVVSVEVARLGIGEATALARD